MSGSIRFSVVGSILHIDISMSNSNIPLQQSFTVSLASKSPLNVLQEIQQQLNMLFTLNGKTLDEVVEKLIVNMAGQKFDQNSLTRIKDDAKYYYKVWSNKDKSGLTNSDTDYNHQTASIVIDMLSWWYIRRLVHIYVVCAILEEVYKHTGTTYTFGNFASPYTNSYSVNVNKAVEIEDLKRKYNEQLDTLNADKQEIKNDFNKLVASYENLRYQNKDLYKKLEEFRELLLHSTSMIFKIEEVPNMIKID